MKGHAQVMSSARTATGTDTWFTPHEILDRVRRVGPIVLDPCTTADNPVGAMFYFTESVDGLSIPWGKGGLVWVNWPYSRSATWAEKVAMEAAKGVQIIVLCAARTDTRWWARVWHAADVVAFWRGRVKFSGAASGAPFPSALLGFNVGLRRFKEAFADACLVVTP